VRRRLPQQHERKEKNRGGNERKTWLKGSRLCTLRCAFAAPSAASVSAAIAPLLCPLTGRERFSLAVRLEAMCRDVARHVVEFVRMWQHSLLEFVQACFADIVIVATGALVTETNHGLGATTITRDVMLHERTRQNKAAHAVQREGSSSQQLRSPQPSVIQHCSPHQSAPVPLSDETHRSILAHIHSSGRSRGGGSSLRGRRGSGGSDGGTHGERGGEEWAGYVISNEIRSDVRDALHQPTTDRSHLANCSHRQREGRRNSLPAARHASGTNGAAARKFPHPLPLRCPPTLRWCPACVAALLPALRCSLPRLGAARRGAA
jgi:uncharacterized membrane protein YgcG